MVTSRLIGLIREGYLLEWNGIHGVGHWARVRENGLCLASITGAKREIVELFAVFHDARRVNEGGDPEHGLRGAKFAAELRGRAFQVSDEEFEILCIACAHHTDERTHGDVTVQTCWDADRLDLGRVGTTPRAEYLSTDAAREQAFMEWAVRRGRDGVVPGFVYDEWIIA